MWNLNYDTNELIYKTDSDIENKHMSIKGEGRGGINWKYVIDRCTHPYTK